jgi:hypothetical protein
MTWRRNGLGGDTVSKEMGEPHDPGLVPWEVFLFADAMGFVFLAIALATIGGPYYFYGSN